MKMFKRTICLLLTLAMLFGILPLSVMAEDYAFKVCIKDTVKAYLYNNFKDAWKKVVEYGGTLEMRADAILSSAIDVPEGIEVTVLTNGYTLERNLFRSDAKNSGEHFVVRKNGRLTIVGGTITGGNNKNGGGAIHVQESGGLILEGVTVTQNRSADNYGGGAIRLQGDNAYLKMDAKTVLSKNYAMVCSEDDDTFYGGGAISVAGDNCTITGDDTLIFGNYSAYDGGAITVAGENCTIKGLDIYGNDAQNRGGGIYLWEKTPNAVISDCRMEENTAYDGGGMYVDCTGTGLSNTVVTNNTAKNLGGGIFVDGGDELNLSGKLSVYGNHGYQNGAAEDATWDDNLYLHVLLEYKNIAGVTVTYRHLGLINNEPDGPMEGNEKVHFGFDESLVANMKIEGYAMVYLSRGPGLYYCHNFEIDVPGWYVFWASGQSELLLHNARQLAATKTPGTIPEKIGYTEVTAENRYTILEDTFYEDTQIPMQHGIFTYCGITDGDLEAEYYYSDGYFTEDPDRYNNHLATMSLAMAMAAMSTNDYVDTTVDSSMLEYQNKGRNIYQLLSDLGFKSTDIYVSDSYEVKPSTDSIAATFGAKELQGDLKDGKPYILLSISVRGAGYESEWASNVTLGSEEGTEAKGFSDSATVVEGYLENFLNCETSMDLKQALEEGRVKFWITGFSRAAAVSNLLAKRLTERYTATVLQDTYDNQVFAYCFAAPRGGVADTCVVEGSKELITHPNIHNVINESDIVPNVYPWQMGLMRYGSDHYMPGSPAGEMQEVTKTFTYQKWDTASYFTKKYSVDYIAYQDNKPYATNSYHYKQRVGTMVQHLAALNPDIKFSDYFRFANVEYVDGALGGSFVQECNSSTSQAYCTAAEWYEFFLQHFMEWALSKNYIDGDIIVDYEYRFRQYYTTETNFLNNGHQYPTVEEALRTLIPVLFTLSGNEEFMEAMTYRFSQISTTDMARLYYDGVIFAYECNSTEMNNLLYTISKIFTGYMTREVYDEELGEYVQVVVPSLNDFVTSVPRSELTDSLHTLFYVLLRFVNEDWWWDKWSDPYTSQDESVLPGAKGSQLHLGTLAYNMGNLIMNHYPEVYMAWLRTDDSYFTDPETGIKPEHAMEFNLVETSVQDTEIVEVYINDEPFDAATAYSGKLKIELVVPDGETPYDQQLNQGNMIYYKLKSDNYSTESWKMYNGPFYATDLDSESLTIEYMLMRFGIAGDVATVTVDTTPLEKFQLEVWNNVSSGLREYMVYGGEPFTITAVKDYKIHKWAVRYDPLGPYVDLDPQPENPREFTITAPYGYVRYYTYYYLPVYCVDVYGLKPITGEPLRNADPSLYYTTLYKKMDMAAAIVETQWYESNGNLVPAGTVAVEGEVYKAKITIRCDETADANLFQIMDESSVNVHGVTSRSYVISEDSTVIQIDCEFVSTSEVVCSDITIETYDLNLNGPTTTPGQWPESLVLNRAAGELVSIPAPSFDNMQFQMWTVSDNVKIWNATLDLNQSTLTFIMPDEPVSLTANYVPIIRRIDVELPPLVAGEPLPTKATSITAVINNTYRLDTSGLSISWPSTASVVEEGVVYSVTLQYGLAKVILEDGTVLSGKIATTEDTQVYINGYPATLSNIMGLTLLSMGFVSTDPEMSILTGFTKFDPLNVHRDENDDLPAQLPLPETLEVTCSNALITNLPLEWTCSQEYSTSTTEAQTLTYYGTLILPKNVNYGLDFAIRDAYYSMDGFQVKLKVYVEGSKVTAKPEAAIGILDDGTGMVTLTAESSKSKIYYTVDGTEPTQNSTRYTEPFGLVFVDGYATVNAIAVSGHGVSSDVATFTYTDMEPAKEPSLTLKYPSLSFEDEVIINVFFDAENLDYVVDMGLVTYYSQTDVADIATADAVTSGYRYDRTTGYYIASTPGIHAKCMADTVYFAAYAKLADGFYIYSDVRSYSPSTYAYNQLKNSTNVEVKQLCAAMLNYGAAAQLYFGHNVDNLVNADLTDDQKALVEEYRSDMVNTIPSVTAEKQGIFANNKGFSVRKPAVSFEGAFSINYFFTPTYTPVDDITLYYWTEADANAADVLTIENATGAIAMKDEGTQFRGDIEGIAAKDLAENIYVAAVYSDGTTTWTSGVLGYSLGAYCASQSTKGGTIADLAKATAVYGYHAKAYFG